MAGEPVTRSASKGERQQRLRRLLAEHDVHSQLEACEMLAAHGIAATQATVSRDLDELGAVKVRAGGGALVYRVGTDPGPAAARSRLAETLQQFVTGVDASGNLAVLRTPPACAHPVASAIDLAELPNVIATVSGDDTVLVVAADGVAGRDLAARLREIADFPSP